MKVGVMGAGAVGCYYGGMLARAGHEVALVGRARHVEAIRREGLLLQTQSFEERIALAASTDARALRGAALVLCCVKSTDTERAGADMAPWIEGDCLVLSLQNGVDNAARLARALSHEVHPAVVYVAAEMAGPGHVRHHGRGELVIGAFAGAEGLAATLAEAGVPVQICEDVAGALWAKLVMNCAYNALSAITRLPYGRLARGEGVPEVMREVTRECLEVARAQGVRLPGDIWSEVERIARTMPGQISSTAQDIASGRRSEIDHLNGYVVRLGKAAGIPTPVNRVLHTLVRLLEAQPGSGPQIPSSAAKPSSHPSR
jgi:2-dehydropantoate 2-reductase